MKYQVPQFIEIEDKIFGPLTFKQFVYVVGTLGASFLLWKSLPSFFAILLIIPVGGFGFALAFYKVNSLPFIDVMENAIRYSLSSRLYLWKKEEKKKVNDKKNKEISEEINYAPKLSESKLSDLSWSLDIHDSLYSGVSGKKVTSNRERSQRLG